MRPRIASAGPRDPDLRGQSDGKYPQAARASRRGWPRLRRPLAESSHITVAVHVFLAGPAGARLVPADPSPGRGIAGVALGDRDPGCGGEQSAKRALAARSERNLVLAGHRIGMQELHRRRRRLRLLEAHLDARHLGDHGLTPLRDELLEELEGLRLIFIERVALRHAA